MKEKDYKPKAPFRNPWDQMCFRIQSFSDFSKEV